MTTSIRRALASATSLIALMAAATPATAQQTQTADAGLALEEVIVTAQKREERLQDVPVAVTVLSTEALERASVGGVEGIQALVPTLTLRKGTTVANSAIVLRGIGTISFSLAAEPAVSTVIDGVVYARSGQAFGDLYDIERIEVLRGPQGTLFGKNASAGVLNIVTKGPSDRFEGDVTLSAFEDEEYRARANISVPFSDKFRTRISASYGEFDGNLRNIFYNTDVNGYQRTGVRGMFDWLPSDDLDIRLIADYLDTDDDCCAEAIGTQPNTAALRANLGAATPLGDKTRQVNHNLISRTIGETGGVSLQINWRVGDHTLTSISAYRDWENRELREGDFMAAGASHVGIFQLHDDGTQDYLQRSQELRITSPSGGTLEYQGGLFFFNVDGNNVFTREDITCTASTLPADATGAIPCRPGFSTFATPSATSFSDVDLKNWAVFGQFTWRITDQFKFIGGLRYTEDDVSFIHSRRNTSGSGGPGIAAIPFPAPGNSPTAKTDEKDLSGRAGLQYNFTDDVMTYFNYARGYKGPAFNVFFNMSANDTLPIAAETADTFEVGFKSTLFDRRLALNVAAFLAEYDNFQANSFRVISGSVVTSLTNAGTVKTTGIDADFNARITENFSLSGGMALADAEIKEFFCPPPGPGVPACSTRKGERLPLAPKWKHSLSADFTAPLGDMPYTAFANVLYSYQSHQFSSLGAFAAERIPGYGLVNVNLGLTDADERYRLTFSVRNLFDKSFPALITPGGQGGAFRYIIPRDADRHFGVTLKASF